MNYKCVSITKRMKNFLLKNNGLKQNPCSPNPCRNGGVCKRYQRAYICLCKNGKQGSFEKNAFKCFGSSFFQIFFRF